MPRVILLAAALAAGPAVAATYQWDVNGATAGLGGAGTWNTTNTFWDDTSVGLNDGTDATAAVGTPNSHTFNFGGTAGTVTVGSSLAAASLLFSVDGYTLATGTNTLTFSGTLTANGNLTVSGGAGGGLAISGAPSVLAVASGKTLTVDAVISGTGSLRKSTGGNLLLTAANTYTGGTVLLGGTTTVSVLANGGSSSSIGASSNAAGNLTFNGGALTYSGTAAASTDRLFSVTAGSFTISNNSATANTLSFTNTGSMTFNTANQGTTMSLSGSNTGLNQFGFLLRNNGTGALALSKTGGGKWVLTNASNSFTGVVTLAAGTLSITSAGALGLGTAVSISNSSSSACLEATNGLTLGADKTITIGNPGSPAVTGLLRNGSSTATTFEVASLIVNFTGSANDLQLASSTGNSGAAIRLSNTANSFAGNVRTGYGVFEYLSVANAGSASALGAGSTVTFVNDSSTATLRHLGASLSSTDRTLVWTGTTGGLVLDSSGTGAVQWLGSAAIKTGAGSAQLKLTGTNSGDNRLAQVINDSGGVTTLAKEGAGTWTLTGANTFSGAVTVSAGRLRAGSLTALGSGAVTVTGGELDLDSRAVANAITLSGGRLLNAASLAGVTLGSAPRLGGTVGGTVDVAGKTVDVAGGLTVTGVLTGAGASFTQGAVTLANGAVHRPGNSPGLQTFSAGLTYAAGSILEWEFAGNALVTRGTDHDGVDVTGGTLSVDALSIIRLINLSAVDYASAEWSTARSFDIVRIFSPASYAGLDTPTLDTSLAGNFSAKGAWSLAVTPELISANWTPVPEPSTYGMALGGLALAGAVVRRRRRA